MQIQETPLPGLLVVHTHPMRDERGSFMRCFCSKELEEIIGGRGIVQINHSKTENIGAIRGLHYQRMPSAEMKLVRCLTGRVWDVAVDLRKNSPTFLQWYAEELSQFNAKMFVLPEGFAHGFQVLEPQSELLYLHTQFYDPSLEGGVRFNDPRLQIPWPRVPSDISSRDSNHPLLDESFGGLPV